MEQGKHGIKTWMESEHGWDQSIERWFWKVCGLRDGYRSKHSCHDSNTITRVAMRLFNVPMYALCPGVEWNGVKQCKQCKQTCPYSVMIHMHIFGV